MNKRQYTREYTSESGVALVFALAMLALLLIMLIGFLASSIFEQRIAYNQSGQSITRTIARSALENAKNMLACKDGITDEIPAFTGYADEENKSGAITNTTPAWRMTPLSSINHTGIDMGTAENEINALLKKQGLNIANYVWDKKINGEENKPQWVPMVVEVPQSGNVHKHITGRYAYAIIPNLGIEPNLLSKTMPTERIGGKYKELPFFGLELTSANWQRIFGKDKWMSLDVLGSRYVLGFGSTTNNNPWTTTLSATDAAREDFRQSDSTTFMEVVNTYFTTDQDRSVNYDEDRIDLAEVGTQADKIAGLIASDSNLKKQIAANIVDYLDKEPNNKPEKPTSDVPPANWLTSPTHPSYTGNEKTPYINQIVPALELKGTYKIETQSISGLAGLLRHKVTRTVSFAPRARVFVELINIYPENLDNVHKIVLKDVKFSVNGEVRFGTTAGDTFVPDLLNNDSSTKTVSKVTFSSETVEVFAEGGSSSNITVSKNGYAVVYADIDLSGSIAAVSDTREMLKNLGSLNKPAADVDMKISDVQFERAVLFDKDGNGVDFVKGAGLDGGEHNFIGSVQENILQADNRNAWVFNTDNQSITSTAYTSFEVKDPRCNLDAGNADEWTEAYMEREKAALKTTGLPGDIALGSANKDAKDMKNDDLTKEQDLEAEEDPAKVSTGYIRNGPMQSVWELGFIHRGKPWQTINLKAAGGADKSYLNDAVLLDEIAFYDSGADKAKEKTQKYNINYPYTHIAAFGPLAKDLKYCPVSENLIPDDGILDAAVGTTLNENQWTSLRKWIAWKCYKSKDGMPSKFDEAKNYHFYRHRGYLANVITDWAINSPDSPYHDEDLMDAYLEELISKIVPLTRAGEPYEYFTIYAVAQSIKDVGGLGANKKIVRYDRTGTLQEGDCQQGKWDPGFDEVTGEVYMVARVRRELTCEGSDSCLDGRHKPGCEYTIHVIESYTLNEL